MIIIENSNRCYHLHQGCVLTIGNFDGVHRGHQALLNQLSEQGIRRGLPVVAMIFEPQPNEWFAIDSAPARLTTLREKAKYLAQAGVDRVACMQFNHQLAQLDATCFIKDILLAQLNVKLLLVGDDFCFGANRSGDYKLLQAASDTYGFTLMRANTFYQHGQRISSTAVRKALAEDDLVLAESLLGRPYGMSGRVIHGDQIGRTLGFPTANLLRRRQLPVKGVYAVEVKGVAQHALPGVANIGTRPTVGGVRQQIEVHLLIMNRDLYQHNIELILRNKIRQEQRFSSLDALKQQIANDVSVASAFFGLK